MKHYDFRMSLNTLTVKSTLYTQITYCQGPKCGQFRSTTIRVKNLHIL